MGFQSKPSYKAVMAFIATSQLLQLLWSILSRRSYAKWRLFLTWLQRLRWCDGWDTWAPAPSSSSSTTTTTPTTTTCTQHLDLHVHPLPTEAALACRYACFIQIVRLNTPQDLYQHLRAEMFSNRQNSPRAFAAIAIFMPCR